jgi:S-DNA-T family DNA segregation ATPase FtsK/SpoIIIE
MSERISVTEFRNALRCPRVFALGRLLGASVAFPIGSSCLGATFHRIVERLAKQVHAPPSSFAALRAGTPRDAVEARLSEWVLELLALELEADPTYWTIPGEVDDLAEALRELSRHLAGRLVQFSTSPALAIAALIQDGERPVEATLGPTGILVRGQLDALYANARGELEVVEYKLTDEANDDLDRAQVALYRELLKNAEGVQARPTVLRFLPTLREVALSSEDADALTARTLIPMLGRMQEWAADPTLAPATERGDLCAACPVAKDCAEIFPARLAARDDPPIAAARPRPGAASSLQAAVVLKPPGARTEDESGQREADEIKERILAELKKQGVAAVCPRAAIVGPTLYVIHISRPRGSVSQLDRAAEDVRHRLASDIGMGMGIDVEYVREGGHRRFIVRRPKPRKVLLAPLLEQKQDFLAARPGRFVVGQCPDGEILCGDFSDSSTAHLLVAGQTGSGKSVLIQSLIASLVQFHGPNAIRFTLIDPKRVTFIGASFKAAVAAHLAGPIRFDVEEALPAIGQLVDLMEERYRLFERAQVADITEFNEQEQPGDRLERRLLVIDEFQDLIGERDSAKTFFAGIKRLGAKARAAGIHMVLATQRPDRETVPPLIKANLSGKIALQVSTKTNSRIVLDAGGAELLHGKGDLLASLGRGVIRAQAPLLSEH